MAAAELLLYPQNEQKLTLSGLTDETGAFVNNALVSATLLDSTGTADPVINNVTLDSIDSNGNYAYTILADSFIPVARSTYTLQIAVSISGIRKITLNIPVSISLRSS